VFGTGADGWVWAGRLATIPLLDIGVETLHNDRWRIGGDSRGSSGNLNHGHWQSTSALFQENSGYLGVEEIEKLTGESLDGFSLSLGCCGRILTHGDTS